MATVVKLDPGSEVAITCNPDGLASAAARQSAVVDLTTGTLGGLTAPLADVYLCGLFQTAAGTLGTNPVVNVWVAVPATGTRYSDNVASTGDAAFTMLASPGMRLVAVVAVDTANVSKDLGEVSLAAALGFLPDKFVVVVENKTGLAFSGTAGQAVNNKISYRAMQYQSV